MIEMKQKVYVVRAKYDVPYTAHQETIWRVRDVVSTEARAMEVVRELEQEDYCDYAEYEEFEVDPR